MTVKKKRPIDLLKSLFDKYELAELNFSYENKVLILNYIVRVKNFDYYKIKYHIEQDIKNIKLTAYATRLYLGNNRMTQIPGQDPEFIEIQDVLKLNRKIIDLAYHKRHRVLTRQISSFSNGPVYIFYLHNQTVIPYGYTF